MITRSFVRPLTDTLPEERLTTSENSPLVKIFQISLAKQSRKGKKERLTAPRRGRRRQCVVWEGVGLLPICRLKYKEKLPLNNSRLRKGCVTK